ncbi:hypothetical protein EAI_07502 [Harpegnathos saltator]|uniref:Uncharacterized protein n=1 Tax=Harpegnathos saltator TaxID=610380 RepID=E2BHY0_HARSA|nr:hypothetical protein EAI_07502 [Harpegnathos saltator]
MNTALMINMVALSLYLFVNHIKIFSNKIILKKTLRKASPDADADADAPPEDLVRAQQGRPKVVAESNSNPTDADAAPEDPIEAKQSQLKAKKINRDTTPDNEEPGSRGRCSSKEKKI